MGNIKPRAQSWEQDVTSGLFMHLTATYPALGLGTFSSHIGTQACLSNCTVHILAAETLFLSRSLPTEPRAVLSSYYVLLYTFNEVYECSLK